MTSPRSNVSDLIFNAVKGTPDLTKETNLVLSQFTNAANRNLGHGFLVLHRLLSDPSRLPKVKGAGRGGSKAIDAGFTSFRTDPWPDLSRSYWKSIRRMYKKGSRTAHTKHTKRFWYERGDRSTASKPPGRPLHEMTHSLVAGGAGNIFHTPLRHTITKTGSRTGFSFDANTVKWSARRGHTSIRGGKVIKVGGFKGRLLMPKTIPIFASNPLGKDFADLLFTAVATQRDTLKIVGDLGIDSQAGPDLLQLLAINEAKRPFISKLFSRLTPLIIERLRTLALTYK